jgi:hypothetical protein
MQFWLVCNFEERGLAGRQPGIWRRVEINILNGIITLQSMVQELQSRKGWENGVLFIGAGAGL